MQINEEQRGEVLVVVPEGRVDSVSAGELEIKLLNRVDSEHYKIVLNLAAVDFVSSAGLRVFLVVAKKLKPYDGRIVLCNILPEVREVFEVSGFASMFSILHSVEDAVSEFN